MAMMGTLFGRSPIRPMQQHMKAAVACARAVVPLFEAMVAGDREALPGLRADVHPKRAAVRRAASAAAGRICRR